MQNTPALLTASEAARLGECTARHINNLITRGELSAKKIDNKYYIDKSEFFRLFPAAFKKEQIGSDVLRLEAEISLLKKMCSDKDREIDFLRNQIEVNNNEKNKMLESLNSHARLLEHKESGSSSHSSSRKSKSWTNIFKKDK